MHSLLDGDRPPNAAQRRDPAPVRWLLEKGGNKNAVTTDGKTPYDYAIEVDDNSETAKLLRR